jgi:hypothetical protein
LKAEQYLCAQDQHARLVQRVFDFVGQSGH